jgi:hypothetical protein
MTTIMKEPRIPYVHREYALSKLCLQYVSRKEIMKEAPLESKRQSKPDGEEEIQNQETDKNYYDLSNKKVPLLVVLL